eukprot:CAMPEP_0173385534 /NCGR_PEP_ID=MMETSP1356-20130122/8142_1 /TAXON_ID=77927 ORGANISM="Hemiselmis virescens, Strain PCC157" /NCGR_SAMPLE_ID=MMETSP1356 /ASSEMBLY_ACC=CAM_ASM_000847 /LENGTH=125 /DNA_ID=CAMNT_0014341379 /DNA_START=285 /DNA_END=658 /DNA_ORIENTATION=-
MLLPAHIDIVGSQVVDGGLGQPHVVLILGEGVELGPVLPVRVLVRVPFISHKGMMPSHNLRLEIRGEDGVLLGEAADLQVPAQETLVQVHILKLHLNVVRAPPTLLRPLELAPGEQPSQRALARL